MTAASRAAFWETAAAVRFGPDLDGLLAEAAALKIRQDAAYAAYRAAEHEAWRAWSAAWEAAWDEAGSPPPHTPQSAAFWRRWDEAVAAAGQDS